MANFRANKAGELPTVSELVDQNPANESAADAAAEDWESDPPDEDFSQLLAAEESE
ncbi:MAG: hypothetical protein HC771_12175 [Synechococcales cyanobacterium CRU_2_2]|nr:hypothetical protein [Synechococcales cyanobacterium CRU_2_2]